MIWGAGGVEGSPLILSKHAACQTATLAHLRASVEVTRLSPSHGDSFRFALAWLTIGACVCVCVGGSVRALNLTAVQY